MEKITDALIGESYYRIDHPSGLTIFLYPKEDFSKTYAIFGAKFGSIDRQFAVNGGERMVLPDGIAHFLEHKLFEDEDGDAFEKYAKTGASANAFTSFDKTAYLFSCTDELIPSLRILLNFVQSPYFTEESVAKEQGIIGQEIGMYDDDPSWQVLFGLLRALYHEHPLKIDIAGTVESIAAITPEVLHTCYQAFYHLSNMALCLCGRLGDVDALAAEIDACLKETKPLRIERFSVEEPDRIVIPRVEKKLSVSVPLFTFGYKEKAADLASDAKTRAADELITQMLNEILAGQSSDFYEQMYQKGWLNQTFASEYMASRGYGVNMFSGESENPDALFAAFRDNVKAYRERGIDPADVERARKIVYARLVREFNSVENLANTQLSCYFMGVDLFDYLHIAKEITVEHVRERFASLFDEDMLALSVVTPV